MPLPRYGQPPTQIDGATVRLVRLKQRRSRRAVATQAGISEAELRFIENGTRGASNPYIVAKLATTLRVPACVITVGPQ